MAKRFQETVSIQPQDVSTGFAQGANTLVNRLQRFKQSSEQLIDVVETRRGAEEAQAVPLEKVEGVTQAPKKKKAGIVETILTGGISTAQYNKSLQTAYLASLGNDTKNAINAIENENADNITQFNEKVAGYVSGVLQGADPAVRGQVSQFVEGQIANSRNRVHRATIKKNKSEAAAQSNEAVISFGNESARLSREGNQLGAAESIAQAFTIIDGMVEGGDLASDRAAVMKREIERESAEQSFRHEFDNTINNEGTTEAFKQLDEASKKVPKGWTPDEWDTFIASEQANINKAVTRQKQVAAQVSVDQAREISNLKIQASTNTGDPSQIVKRTEELFNARKITPSERTSILTNIVNGQKDAQKQAEDFQLISARLAGEDGIVIEGKIVDKYYQENMQQQVNELPPELKSQAQALFVDRMKRIPAGMKLEITTKLRSENPDLIAEASTLIDRVDEIPGLVNRTFTAQDRAFAQQVVDLSSNMVPAEAVKLARQLTDPTDKSRVEAITALIKNEKLRENYPGIVQDAFNPIGPFEGTQVDPITLPQITKEYEDLFEAHYQAGMTEDGAREKALSLIKRNWKKSEVTGTVMKYRPDDYYSVAGDVEYIKKQLVSDVNEEFVFAESVNLDEVFLQATETTARTASQGEPEYRVVLIRDGNLTPLYGFTWKPDAQAQIKKSEKENKKRLEEQRKKAGDGPAILKEAPLGL